MRTKRIKNKLRRIAFFTLFFFVSDIAPIPYWIPWAPAEIYSHIAGKVTDAQTGETVASLDIIAVKSGDTTGRTFSAKTTSKGNYDICCAPPGMYQLLIDPQSPYIREFPHKEVTVIRGRNVINANFTVQKGSFVSGTVFDSDGVTPTKVSIVLADQIDETEQDLTYFFAVEKGRHILTGLKPNKTYRLYANGPNQASVFKDVQTTSTGQVMENMNLTLGDPATKISGIVESNGIKIKDAEVRVMSDKVSGYATTNEEGQFEISGLIEGSYVFTVIAPNYEPFGEFNIQIQSQQQTVKNVSLTLLTATSSKIQMQTAIKRVQNYGPIMYRISSVYAATPAFAFAGSLYFQWQRLERAAIALSLGNTAVQRIKLFDLANQIRSALFEAGIPTAVSLTTLEVVGVICATATPTGSGDWVTPKSSTGSDTGKKDICDMLAAFCELVCQKLSEYQERACRNACEEDRKFCKEHGGRWPIGPESKSLKYMIEPIP